MHWCVDALVHWKGGLKCAFNNSVRVNGNASPTLVLFLMQVTLSGLLEVQPNQVTISQVKVQERRGKTESSVVILSSAKVHILCISSSAKLCRCSTCYRCYRCYRCSWNAICKIQALIISSHRPTHIQCCSASKTTFVPIFSSHIQLYCWR